MISSARASRARSRHVHQADCFIGCGIVFCDGVLYAWWEEVVRSRGVVEELAGVDVLVLFRIVILNFGKLERFQVVKRPEFLGIMPKVKLSKASHQVNAWGNGFRRMTHRFAREGLELRSRIQLLLFE